MVWMGCSFRYFTQRKHKLCCWKHYALFFIVCGIFIFWIFSYQNPSFVKPNLSRNIKPSIVLHHRQTRKLSKALNSGGFAKNVEPKIELDSDDDEICTPPIFNITAVKLDKYFHRYPPLKCEQVQPNLVEIKEDGTAKLKNLKLLDYSCTYQCFDGGYSTYASDSSEFGWTYVPLVYSEYVKLEQNSKIPCEFFHVLCTSNKNDSNVLYADTFTNVQPNPSTLSNKKKNTNKTSVILFVMEATTKIAFAKNFPNSIKVLSSMGAISLNGYSRTGRNSLPNGAAFLMGRRVDIKEESWEIEAKTWEEYQLKYHDDLPIIWKNFSKNGYVTMTQEDWAATIFHYETKGFMKKPTDHFYRPMSLSIEKGADCYQNRVTFDIFKDYLLQFLRAYNGYPTFSLSWIVSPFHYSVDIGSELDNNLADLLNSLKPYMDNSVLFLIGDHGNLYSRFRNSPIGSKDMNSPAFSVVLPKSIRKQYPDIVKNLEGNQDVLTTHFDLYVTMLDILSRGNEGWKNLKKQEKWSDYGAVRGLSLFRPIPPRSCKSAGNRVFCPCKSFITVCESHCHSDEMVEAGNIAVVKVNQELIVNNITNLCAEWHLTKVFSFSLLIAKSNKNYTCHRARFGLEVEPISARFLAKVSMCTSGTLQRKQPFNFTISDVPERISLHGKTADCVQGRHLKEICFCKHQADPRHES